VLGCPAPARLHLELRTAWSEPHRNYHDGRHLRECLALCSSWQGQCERAVEVALALWFHDAIYEPAGADSELQSAAWAARALAKAGVSSEVAQRVYELVMATRHQAPVEGLDAQLLVDVDLAILGSPEVRFLAYDSDIRKEFARVAEARYRAGRRDVFSRFPSGSRRSSPSRCGPRTRWRRGHRAARGRRAHAALAFQRRRRSATRLRRKRKPIGRGSRRSCPRWFSDLRDGCRATCGRRRILGTFGASRRTGQAAPLRTPAGRLRSPFCPRRGTSRHRLELGSQYLGAAAPASLCSPKLHRHRRIQEQPCIA
jgi:predicted metal-dependent HD superfamily phosphohydrolase